MFTHVLPRPTKGFEFKGLNTLLRRSAGGASRRVMPRFCWRTRRRASDPGRQEAEQDGATMP